MEMAENGSVAQGGGLAGVNPGRLFLASRVSLISTSVVFGVMSSIIPQLTKAYSLTDAQAGWIGGATLWGFTIAIWIFGPMCDKIGMGLLMRVAMLCHLVGPLVMMFAAKLTPGNPFIALFTGGLIMALGNGTVQGVVNPLVTTIFPDESTRVQKMNLLHMWFPGGIAIGGVLSFLIDKMGISAEAAFTAWQMKLVLVLIPTVAYGILFTGQKFPKTEQAESGQSFGDMCSGTFGSLAFWLLFIAMGISASIELGPGTWMTKAMTESMGKAMPSLGDGAGVLVLVYTSVLVMVMRLFAGSLASKLSPIGMLLLSAVLAGVGLFGLTKVQGGGLILVLATVYAVGYCYFWPTTLGVTSMWVRKGGSLAMSIVNGWGNAAVGLIAAPAMGFISDKNGGGTEGMMVSFRYVAASAVVLLVIYGVLAVTNKKNA
jgi:fucose permease